MPGTPIKVLLDRYVPKIESPTAQPGNVPPAAMKSFVVRFRRAARGGRGRERGAHRGDDGEVRGFARGLPRRRLEDVDGRRGWNPGGVPSDVAAPADDVDGASGDDDDGAVELAALPNDCCTVRTSPMTPVTFSCISSTVCML